MRNFFQENYSAVSPNKEEFEDKKKKQQSDFYVPRR